MARVEIVFEDNSAEAGGSGMGVSCKCTPDASVLMKKWNRKETMTPAEAMALTAIASALRSSQDGELADRIRGKNQIIV